MITQDVLKQLLQYDPETGIFTWRYRPIELCKNTRSQKIFNTSFCGKIAGNIHRSSVRQKYRTIRVFDVLFYEHRLAWIYVYGSEAEYIDHIDGNVINNRICNLRSVDNSTNLKNSRLNSKNTSGHCGVYFNKEIKKWVSQAKINGKTSTLGTFIDKLDAASLRKKFENENGYHENHGRIF